MFSRHVTVHFLSFSDPVEPTVSLVHSGSKVCETTQWTGSSLCSFSSPHITTIWSVFVENFTYGLETQFHFKHEVQRAKKKEKKRFRHINPRYRGLQLHVSAGRLSSR